MRKIIQHIALLGQFVEEDQYLVWSTGPGFWWRWCHGHFQCCDNPAKDVWEFIDTLPDRPTLENAVHYSIGFTASANGIDLRGA